MSYLDDDDDAYGDPSQNNPLRKVVKDLEKKLAAEAKARQEAEETAAKLSKTVRSRTVADVLKDKGANPALARFALQDLEDPTPEAVASWLTENGQLFGYTPQAADPAQVLGLPAGTALPPDLVAAYERFMSGQQGGSNPVGGDPILAALNDPNLTREQLEALIATAN